MHKYDVQNGDISKCRKARPARTGMLLLVWALVATVVPTAAQEVCSTRGCRQAAEVILSNMDDSINPCENFYEFACGRYVRERSIPEGRQEINSIQDLQDDILNRIKRIVRRRPKTGEPSYLTKIKNYYNSCIRRGKDRRGFKPLRKMIDLDFNGWPLSRCRWKESSFDLEPAVLKANRLNVSAIFKVSVVENFNLPPLRVLKIAPPSTYGFGGKGFYKDLPRNDPAFLAYEERIFEIAKQFGVVDEEVARQDISEMVDFEYELGRSATSGGFQVNFQRTMTAWDERKSVAVLKWPFFFEQVTQAPEIGINDLSGEDKLFIDDPAYFEKSKFLLLKTSNRTLANYIVWRVIDNYLDTVGTKATRKEKITKKLQDDCLSSMIYYNDFRTVASKIFVDKYYTEDDKEYIESLVTKVQRAFNETIDEKDWLFSSWSGALKDKNGALKSRIGFPEDMLEEENIERMFANVTFERKTYFENKVAFNRDSFDRNIRVLRTDVGPDDMWIFSPVQVNAFYDEYNHVIEIPAAISQSPFYQNDYPTSYNYGGIGVTTAHEILHGYDFRGIFFNAEGKSPFLGQNNQFFGSLVQRATCLQTQYENILVPETNTTINAVRTINENIGDNSAIPISFRAYRNWVEAQGGEEAPVERLTQYSNDQLFFIGYAQAFCQIVTEEEALRQSQLYPYPLSRYRVNVPLQNSEDFAAAFSCPVNSTMNPEAKCRVW